MVDVSVFKNGHGEHRPCDKTSSPIRRGIESWIGVGIIDADGHGLLRHSSGNARELKRGVNGGYLRQCA